MVVIIFKGAVSASSFKGCRASTFSVNTKQERMAAHCSGVRSLNAPWKIISVKSSSSAELISQATLSSVGVGGRGYTVLSFR